MWQNYCTLFEVLVQWLKPYVGAPEAAAVARRAMSQLARLSWHGYQTQEGPFSELISLCVADIASHGFLGWHAGSVQLGGPQKVLDEEGLAGLCALYAGSYLMCYEGMWSLQERELVYQFLRLHDPKPIPSDWEDPLEAAHADIRPLLRRALMDVEHFFTRGTLADEAATSIADDELLRSVFWARQFKP